MDNRKHDAKQHAQDHMHEQPREATGDYVAGPNPTAERARQKAKIKEGHVPKTRKQVVEDHYDDCGSDLAGLAPLLTRSSSRWRPR